QPNQGALKHPFPPVSVLNRAPAGPPDGIDDGHLGYLWVIDSPPMTAGEIAVTEEACRVIA
ncbi:hypothetical protein, partial [Specibacter cremeus]|uniref:hypothetical protein n=1 Tax=Specibacter cremeus TaxID=1629051 RepID=UPI00197C7E7B